MTTTNGYNTPDWTLTAANYDVDFGIALQTLVAMDPLGEYPEGEQKKALTDRLNNTWAEGMTLQEWIEAARA